MNSSDPSNQGIVSLHDVSKRYGSETVVADVGFCIKPGESVVLIGHNGAGKTTLIKLMLGLTRPSSGRLRVLGGNPVDATALADGKTLGYLPENLSFYDAMTGREILNFYARLKDVSTRQADDLLECVGLATAAQRRVATYSKGMRQRLGLAQAMLGQPQLLFLDEPTTGLDPGLRHQFYQLIKEMQGAGATSIISSHALNEVEAKANRFMIMNRGLLVASGSLEELFQQAALPVRLELSVAPGKATAIAERLGGGIAIDEITDMKLNLSCDNDDKMSVIRRISDLGDSVRDLLVMPPRLDEVYLHLTQGARS